METADLFLSREDSLAVLRRGFQATVFFGWYFGDGTGSFHYETWQGHFAPVAYPMRVAAVLRCQAWEWLLIEKDIYTEYGDVDEIMKCINVQPLVEGAYEYEAVKALGRWPKFITFSEMETMLTSKEAEPWFYVSIDSKKMFWMIDTTRGWPFFRKGSTSIEDLARWIAESIKQQRFNIQQLAKNTSNEPTK